MFLPSNFSWIRILPSLVCLGKSYGWFACCVMDRRYQVTICSAIYHIIALSKSYDIWSLGGLIDGWLCHSLSFITMDHEKEHSNWIKNNHTVRKDTIYLSKTLRHWVYESSQFSKQCMTSNSHFYLDNFSLKYESIHYAPP